MAGEIYIYGSSALVDATHATDNNNKKNSTLRRLGCDQAGMHQSTL